jgi:hypothetical protein
MFAFANSLSLVLQPGDIQSNGRLLQVDGINTKIKQRGRRRERRGKGEILTI